MTARSRHLKAILSMAELVALVEKALDTLAVWDCPECKKDLSGYIDQEAIPEFVVDFVGKLEKGETP